MVVGSCAFVWFETFDCAVNLLVCDILNVTHGSGYSKAGSISSFSGGEKKKELYRAFALSLFSLTSLKVLLGCFILSTGT